MANEQDDGPRSILTDLDPSVAVRDFGGKTLVEVVDSGIEGSLATLLLSVLTLRIRGVTEASIVGFAKIASAVATDYGAPPLSPADEALAEETSKRNLADYHSRANHLARTLRH